MDKNELQEINKYCSPESLLVILPNGKLVRINCPFQVVCLYDIDKYNVGQKLTVLQVKMDNNFILVYIIESTAYHYFNFYILIG
jgi:hypothetical protein